MNPILLDAVLLRVVLLDVRHHQPGRSVAGRARPRDAAAAPQEPGAELSYPATLPCGNLPSAPARM